MRPSRLIACAVASIAGALLASQVHAVVIAQWTFDDPVDAGSNQIGPQIGADIGSGTLYGRAIHSHFTWQNAFGNGSANAYEGQGSWSTGAYWQFDFSTAGYNSISLSFDVASKATGPRDFKIQTSFNGNEFADYGFTYQVPFSTAWDPAAVENAHRITINSLGSQFDNLQTVYVRLVQTTTISAFGTVNGITTSGTSRIDNITVQGVLSSVPEASAFLLTATVAGTCLIAKKRRWF